MKKLITILLAVGIIASRSSLHATTQHGAAGADDRRSSQKCDADDAKQEHADEKTLCVICCTSVATIPLPIAFRIAKEHIARNASSNEPCLLACAHIFHSQCINAWITAEHSTCPSCKMHIPADFGGYEAEKGGERHVLDNEARIKFDLIVVCTLVYFVLNIPPLYNLVRSLLLKWNSP